MSTKKMLSSVAIALSLIVSISMLSSCGAAIDKLIDKMVVEGNKQCPVSMNSEMRLDSISHPGKGIIEYSYTLVNVTAESLAENKDQVVSMMEAQKPQMISMIKNTADNEMKAILKLNATFRYTYLDKDGNKITSLDITPEDYK